MRTLVIVSICFCIQFSDIDIVFSWEDKITHRALSEYAAKKSNLAKKEGNSLQNLGMKDGLYERFRLGEDNKEVFFWIQDGSELEDAGTMSDYASRKARSLNHFHNPIHRAENWGSAGLNDFLLIAVSPFKYNLKGESLILWSQDSETQAGCPEGDWTWQRARELFRLALTSETDSERQANFAKTFRALGHQMHLIQDCAVPDHARNDAHPEDSIEKMDRYGNLYFEAWAQRAYGSAEQMKGVHSDVKMPDVDMSNYSHGLVSICNLVDTDKYDGTNPSTGLDIGLAEFTNANFFSGDTFFADSYDESDEHYFPHPKRENTDIEGYIKNEELPELGYPEDGLKDYVIYIKSKMFTENKRLVRASYHTDDIVETDSTLYFKTFYRDEKCHVDYASHLIPRAVGYSTALINYFFRGRMEIRHASVKLGPGLNIDGLEFEVKNTTSPLGDDGTVEPFGAGTLDLVYQYVLPGNSEPVFHHIPDVYAVSYEDDPINSEFVHLDIDFPPEAVIPAGAGDFCFMVVFSGQLGNEFWGIVAKMHDFSESSRIAYRYQPEGFGKPSDIYTINADGTDEKKITDAVPYESWYYFSAWSPDGSMMAFGRELCIEGDPNTNLWCEGDYSYNIAVVDLTSEFDYPYNILNILRFACLDCVLYRHTFPAFSHDGGRIISLLAPFEKFYTPLVVMDVKSSRGRYLLDKEFWYRKNLKGSAPAWSPKEDRIAYYIHEEKDPETLDWHLERDIYAINADGTTNIRLTNDNHWNTQPSWSPDGDWIVFASDRDGQGALDIWIMDKTGGNRQKIYDCDPSCFSPGFSPDGLRIVFASGGAGIYTVNLNGTDPKEVVTPGYLTEAPAWSPFLPKDEEP